MSRRLIVLRSGSEAEVMKNRYNQYEVDWGSSEDSKVYLNGLLANSEGVFLPVSRGLFPEDFARGARVIL